MIESLWRCRMCGVEFEGLGHAPLPHNATRTAICESCWQKVLQRTTPLDDTEEDHDWSTGRADSKPGY